MEKEKLKELVINHKKSFLSRVGLIDRDVRSEIERYIPQREIVIITGVRRSGKSSLMRLICDDLVNSKAVPVANILFLNFEDERFAPFSLQDFESLYELFIEIENPQGRKYLFFDEIQNVTGWEKWLSRLNEFEDVKIFVTGSNASLLSSDISTALTGRNRQIVNWPFSFREYLSLKGVPLDGKNLYQRETKAEIKRQFGDYFESGGFPGVIEAGDQTLLEQYYADIIYRDVIARYSIKNIRELKELALYLASHPATIQSYQNLQSITGIKSVNTVKNFLSAFSDVYLFFKVDLFDFSIKRQIYNPSKIYCIDVAMNNAISFRYSRNVGRLYESIVYVELRRRKEDLYYWKSRKGTEVDFVIRKGLHLTEAIQVCASLSDEKTRSREIRALLDAFDELKVGKLTIITDDEEETVNTGGVEIRVVPLWKWLIT